MLQSVSRHRRKLSPASFLPLVLGFALATTGLGAHAQTTPRAGDTIGNRASATYDDGSGVSRTVTSNEVVTTIQ